MKAIYKPKPARRFLGALQQFDLQKNSVPYQTFSYLNHCCNLRHDRENVYTAHQTQTIFARPKRLFAITEGPNISKNRFKIVQ